MTESKAKAVGDQVAAKRLKLIQARLNEMLGDLDRRKELLDRPSSVLLEGVERWYSATEAARFFGRSNQWMYENLKSGRFKYANGDPIVPHYDVPKTESNRPPARFNLTLIKDVALSCYRSGFVKYDELKVILHRIAQAEVGEIVLLEDENA
jgi:hypothetical protein